MHVSRVALPATTSLASPAAPLPAASSLATRSPWPAWLSRVLAQAAERRQLLAMEERDLRDVGLTPAEARILARKPLWRA
jgi:uncharacterized protein YjiS (DUF1127 family)